MVNTLDEALDEYLKNLEAFQTMGEEKVREITRLNMGTLVLDIYTEAMKDAMTFTDFSNAFRAELKKRFGIPDESIE